MERMPQCLRLNDMRHDCMEGARSRPSISTKVFTKVSLPSYVGHCVLWSKLSFWSVCEEPVARKRPAAPARPILLCIRLKSVSEVLVSKHSAKASAPSSSMPFCAKRKSHKQLQLERGSAMARAPSQPMPLRLRSSTVTVAPCSTACITFAAALGPKPLSPMSSQRSLGHRSKESARTRPPCSPSSLERRLKLVSTWLPARALASSSTRTGSAPMVGERPPPGIGGPGPKSKLATKCTASQRI
mmetsp:Transcript_4637/g.9536  ORF Transcript_4637/g.9536 Transcript_4637/m.9536 type:complete len:243 (+) Transcript_4637:986-1714(+)